MSRQKGDSRRKKLAGLDPHWTEAERSDLAKLIGRSPLSDTIGKEIAARGLVLACRQADRIDKMVARTADEERALNAAQRDKLKFLAMLKIAERVVDDDEEI